MKSSSAQLLYVFVRNNSYMIVHILADSGIFKSFLYQGGVKSTVSSVFEDLKFKISEGYDQNQFS